MPYDGAMFHGFGIFHTFRAQRGKLIVYEGSSVFFKAVERGPDQIDVHLPGGPIAHMRRGQALAWLRARKVPKEHIKTAFARG
jgi:hypothetical protein